MKITLYNVTEFRNKKMHVNHGLLLQIRQQNISLIIYYYLRVDSLLSKIITDMVYLRSDFSFISSFSWVLQWFSGTLGFLILSLTLSLLPNSPVG